MPVSSWSARARPRSRDPVWIAATRPYSVSLATATASASSLTTITGATGPKISSWKAGIAGVTPPSTVGE